VFCSAARGEHFVPFHSVCTQYTYLYHHCFFIISPVLTGYGPTIAQLFNSYPTCHVSFERPHRAGHFGTSHTFLAPQTTHLHLQKQFDTICQFVIFTSFNTPPVKFVIISTPHLTFQSPTSLLVFVIIWNHGQGKA
jgi:hypothetical protein